MHTDANAYELLALCMRYVFAALMVLILLRAVKITMVDWRRSAKLRHLSPETGIVGEFLVVDGHERSKNGMHYPVILEGTIGSGKKCDIRLRSSTVRRRHALFQMTGDGLFIRGHARCRLRDGFGRPVRDITMRDGDFITIGAVRLMLIISGGETPREMPAEHRPHFRQEDRNTGDRGIEPGISRTGDDLFDVEGESFSHEQNNMSSGTRNRPQYRDSRDEEDDVFYDYDEYDDC